MTESLSMADVIDIATVILKKQLRDENPEVIETQGSETSVNGRLFLSSTILVINRPESLAFGLSWIYDQKDVLYLSLYEHFHGREYGHVIPIEYEIHPWNEEFLYDIHNFENYLISLL